MRFVEIIVFLFLTAPEKEEFMQVMIILGKYIFRTARIIQILHILNEKGHERFLKVAESLYYNTE